MSDTLLIHYYPTQAERTTWSVVNDKGELISKITQGPLEQAADLARQNRVVILLDDSVIHISTVDLPAMSQQKLQRAIPFALEEQIADEVEDLHFVASASKDSPTFAAGINRKQLDRILDELAQVGIQADAIVPDSLCLAASNEQWCALFDDDQVILQTQTLLGNVYDKENFDAILTAELSQADSDESTIARPKKIVLFCKEDTSAPDISGICGDDIEIIHVSYNTHPIVVYCGNYRQAMPLNLLQHEYKPKNKHAISWRKWALAASLAAVWVIISLGSKAYQLHEVRQLNRQMEAEIIKIYKTSFPKSKKIVNARVQMEQKLKELKAGGGNASSSMVALLSQSARALAADRTIQLKSLSFRNNRLDISVTGNNLNALQNLNNKLNQIQGIRSEILSSNSEQNAVTGSLRLQAAS